MTESKDYLNQSKQELSDWEEKINGLENRIKHGSAGPDEEMKTLLKELRDKHTQLQEHVELIEKDIEDPQVPMKEKVSHTRDELSILFNSIMKNIE